jgi:hypothetical protein
VGEKERKFNNDYVKGSDINRYKDFKLAMQGFARPRIEEWGLRILDRRCKD